MVRPRFGTPRGTSLPGEAVTEILDIIHVSGYLWGANLLCNTPDAARAWAKTQIGAVLPGQVADVIAHLSACSPLPSGEARERRRVQTYLFNNRHRMAYDAYLAAGFPIVSGVIEGAGRHLVKDRMERSGIRYAV